MMSVMEPAVVEGEAEEAPGGTRGPDVGWVAGAVAALIGLIIGTAPIHDNSFLTHLATGRLILDTGGLPRVDPYSFTAAGDPWTIQSWLASVAYAGVEDLGGGLGAVRLLNGVLCAAIAVGLWHLTARSRSLLVRAGVVLATLAVASELLPGRPLLFGILGFVLALLALDGRIDPRWMVPVGYVWVNTHGSFPFALALAATFALGTRLDEGRWGPEVRVGAWIAGGIALGGLNPLGLRILVFPLKLAGRTEAFQNVAEWQRPDFTHWFQIATAALLLVTAGLLVRRRSWRDAIPLVLFAGLGLTSARNLITLLIVLVPILAGVLPERGPAVADVRRPILGPARVAVVALVALFTVVAMGRPDVVLDAYPEEASVWMDENGMWGPDSRVVAPDYVGNLREAQAGADARVFIDDRIDMYPLPVIRDYITVLRAEPGWQDVLAEHDATAVLWRRDTDLGRALLDDPGWRPVHRDGAWSVFVPA